MTLANYDGLQETSVKWLGDVPAHWKIGRFRHHFRESPEKIDKEVVGVMLSVSGYRGIEIKEYDDENRRRLDEELVNYRIVRVGQLVVNSMWLNAAGLGVSDFEGHVSPAYRCYWIGEGLNLRYIHHLMRSAVYVLAYTSMAQGIRPNSLQLSRTDLMNLPILIPPPDEQKAISSFLDVETSKIDGLVSEQRRLIELLKEKRQAVISHAVTKGLNPNAPMKPSGIQWLGDVPKHWEVMKFGQLSNVVRGGSPRPAGDPTLFNGDFSPWVTVSEITKDDEIDLTETSTFLTEKGSRESRLFNAGTLLLTNSGGSLGVPKILRIEANANDGVLGFLDLELNNHFAYFYLTTLTEYLREIVKKTGGSTQINLNTHLIKQLAVPVPPKDEAEQIVGLIIVSRYKFRALEAESERAIELLQERRTALISAAVTGKIDVREFAYQETA